jgi:hypothetical protein
MRLDDHSADWSGFSSLVGIAVSSTELSFCPLVNLEGAQLIKETEMEAILEASASCDYTPSKLLAIRQVASLLTKNAALPGCDSRTRRLKAVESFLATERRLQIVNKRLRHFRSHVSRQPKICAVLNDAALEIFRLLGDAPTEEVYRDVVEFATFGPGSVGGIERLRWGTDVTPYGKLSPQTIVQVTPACLQTWGGRFLDSFCGWLREQPAALVSFCKGTTVPKDCRTDRFIAVEPWFNSYVQLGQMNWLARRLKRWGVNTQDQTWNQELAGLASKVPFPDGWATLDLSSASDSVSTEILRWLLPPAWYQFFDSSRSPVCKIDGVDHTLNKFSSMGNGNTFPLECLVFASLVRACRKHAGDKQPYAVYGDDIIVSHRCVPLLTEALTFSGFKLNQEKSFVIGRFRESCGRDYLDGHPVRPIFLQDPPTPFTAVSLFNKLQAANTNPAIEIFLRSRYVWMPVGPATTPSGAGDLGHFVAPISVLLKEGVARWNNEYQTYHYRWHESVLRQRRISRRRKSLEIQRALIAYLGFSMRSDPHPVRESSVAFEHAGRGGYQNWFLPQYSMAWLS